MTALGRLGPAARVAIPDLSTALADQYGLVRAQSAHALGRIGVANPGAAVPPLAQALRDRSPGLRYAAAMARGAMGNSAANAVENLRAATQDRDTNVRAAAQEALKMIEGKESGPKK